VPARAFAAALDVIARDHRQIYTCFRPEVLGSASAHDTIALAAATKADPWDGRPSREEAFLGHLQATAPQSEIRDLDPIVDRLRSIKSPREIAVIRQATQLAGLGIIEAMRDAEPGLSEYQLQADAEYVFKNGGAYGASYFALIATGTNTLYSHNHKDTALLADGDLVQFDYAPDYKYYASDVTRVFPASGRFTPRQREFYGIYLQLYQALMTSIAVHASPGDVAQRAVEKMDAAMRAFTFTDPKIREAGQRFVDGYRNRQTVTSLGHSVGMEVHDVGAPAPTLEPGMIFTIEPAMQLPEEHLGIRLEDMILITTDGYENLSAFVPVEIDDIEKTMAEPGLRRPERAHQ
jgi:Xaa-Pro aminopeptidase